MPLFAAKNKNVLGVDIGSHVIKIVELANQAGTPRLVTYGIAELDRQNLSTNIKQNIAFYADSLRALIDQSHATAGATVGALPATSAFTTVIQLPRMPKKEIDSAVRWEAKKLVPLPLEKMSLDWHIVATEEKTMNIILTAASKDMVTNTMSIFEQAQVKLIGLETEISALRRAFLHQTAEATMIMDIGATNTNVAMFHRGVPAITRNIDIGGQTITVNIANSMNINVDRAEQFKNHFGPTIGSQPEHPVSRAIQFVIDNMIISEIRPLISAFESAHKTTIELIILAGGTAHLVNLVPYLEKILNKRVIIGNPWTAISHPAELTPELEKIGPEMAVAVGLALKQ
jgi:type IV pilus assembly protein PilM